MNVCDVLVPVQVVYFRANNSGACEYVNDSRYWRYSHGTCWSELAEDLLVVDVPGDHFSLLRQDPPDMEVSPVTQLIGAHTYRPDSSCCMANLLALVFAWDLLL